MSERMSAADAKEQGMQAEHTPVPVRRQSKRKTCMRHCKRFWWAYLIVFILIVVLVVCLIIFVAVPKIAQNKINEAELDIQNVRILETRPNEFLMEIDSTIRTHGGISAKVYPFEGEMILEDGQNHNAFATLQFPETSAAKEQVVNISQVVQIQDMDAFTNFNTYFFQRESVRVTIQGKTQVSPKGLDRKYGVDFKKTLDVKGLNLLKGTEVLDGEISLEHDERGRNFNGTVDIPNDSHFTLDLGNVEFTNFVGDETMGTLYIDDLVLKPGSNVVNMTADMDQFAILALVRSPEYCKTGIIPFKLQGLNVTNDGEHLSYFSDALASANQTVSINIGEIITNSLGGEIKCRE